MTPSYVCKLGDIPEHETDRLDAEQDFLFAQQRLPTVKMQKTYTPITPSPPYLVLPHTYVLQL